MIKELLSVGSGKKLKSTSSGQTSRSFSPGITLIEMLIIAPIIIIFLGVMIVMISNVTGDSLQAREKNAMAYNVQNALDLIETEGSRSATYPATTGTLTSPQGSNGSTAAFTVAGNDASSTDNDVLIVKTPATTTNPIDSNKGLIYYNTPNACASADVSKNDYYPVTTVYFVSSGALWQRTILPSSGTPCSTPWQRASCAESQPLTGVCKAYDEKLVTNVTSFSVQYLDKNGGSMSSADTAEAKAVNITIRAEKSVAGETISYSGSTRSVAIHGGIDVTAPNTILLTKSKKSSFGATSPNTSTLYGHACAVASGSVYCWGDGYAYETGDGNSAATNTPVLVGGALTGKTVTSIFTAKFGSGNSTPGSTCAIADGSLYCWGRNELSRAGSGLLGVGTATTTVTTPTLVGGAMAGKTVGQ